MPYTGPSASAIITKHVTDPAPSARAANPDVSRACDELIQRMMAKDPNDRPQTPTELLSDIDDALAGRVHLRPGPRAKTRAMAARPARRPATRPAAAPAARKTNALPWLFAGIGVLVLAIVLIVLATRGGGPPRPKTGPAQVALQQADAWAKAHPSDFDGAIARYQAVADGHGGTHWAGIAAGRVTELRRRKAAATAGGTASKQIEAAIAKLKTTAGGLAAEERVGDALRAIDAFAADQQAAALLKAFWAAVEEGLKLRVGQFLAFGGEGGTITAVRDGQVTLKTPKGEATLPIAKLGAKQALLYVLLKDDPRSHLIRGVYLLAEQTELDEAAQALAAAGDAPHVAHYRDRLDALRLGAAEVAARRAWGQIQSYAKAKLTPSRAARLRTLLEAFAAKYGNTKLAASIQGDITTLRGRVAAGEAPKAGGWQNLFDGKTLRGWEPVKPTSAESHFAGTGRIYVEGGQIILEEGVHNTGIGWTRDFPTMGYEVVVDAMAHNGRGQFGSINFPMGESRGILVVGGWGGTIMGIELVDGHRANDNPATARMATRFEHWYRVRLRVSRARIEAWLDDKKMIDFRTAGHTIALPAMHWSEQPFAVHAYKTKASVRNIRLRRLD